MQQPLWPPTGWNFNIWQCVWPWRGRPAAAFGWHTRLKNAILYKLIAEGHNRSSATCRRSVSSVCIKVCLSLCCVCPPWYANRTLHTSRPAKLKPHNSVLCPGCYFAALLSRCLSRSCITVWPWVSTVFISSLTACWGTRLHVLFISPLRTHRSSRKEGVLKFTARNRPMSRRAQIMTKNPPTIQGISFNTSPFFWVLIPLQNFVRKNRRKPRLCLANDVQTGCCFSIWALFKLCQLYSEVRTCHREPR